MGTPTSGPPEVLVVQLADHAQLDQFPPIPDVPYVIGFRGGDGLVMHAVTQKAARDAVARADNELDAGWARAECGRSVVLARRWGAFQRGNEHVDRKTHLLCPHCAWAVALATGRVDDELAALDPDESDVPVLRRHLDPGIVRRVCERILAAAREDGDLDDDFNHPQVVEQLAYVTAHQPHVLMGYECADGTCDHDGDRARCKADWAIVACSTCSLLAGAWAGEWEGCRYVVSVSAPCSALAAMVAHYGLAPGIRINRSGLRTGSGDIRVG